MKYATTAMCVQECERADSFTHSETQYYTQDVYKWMVQFQKLTNLFLTLHGQNLHRQQQQLSKFLMRYQQFARSCLLRGCGASLQDGVVAGKGFLCAPIWGVQICDYSAASVLCMVRLF